MNWQMTDDDFEVLKGNIQKELEDIKVSPLHILELLETFDNPYSTEEDFHSILLRIFNSFSDLDSTKLYFNNSRKNVIKYVEDEIYKLICKSNKEYSKERTSLVTKYETVITLVSASMSAKFGIESGLISGIVSSVLLTIIKLGKNAWCIRKTDTLKGTQ
ncbi:hypothetical protein [Paenibacillus sp. SAF-068]|uniref:hypothetical protein n=1 Tax=Paenibacillus sp. SAF-068 TaxID=3436864 RepID=UPI003F814777